MLKENYKNAQKFWTSVQYKQTMNIVTLKISLSSFYILKDCGHKFVFIKY